MSGGIGSVCFYCADQNPHRDRSLGITNYTFGLLNALKQSGVPQLRAIVSKSSSGVPDVIPKTTLPFRTDHTLGRLVADHLHAVMLGNRVDASIWHYPKGFLPLGKQVRQPKIGTIADTILQFYADHYPNQRSRAAYAYWIAMLKNSVRKLDLIITVSEFSKHSIIEFADRYRIKAPPIHVTYQGAMAFASTARDRSSRDYVLHLASKQPHKKTNWLLQEWQRLETRGLSVPKLRLIGDVDATGHALIRQLKNVKHDNQVVRGEIGNAMSGALALILPSEIEGFGLPALEAYYTGTPVLYIKDTAVEEVLGAGTPCGFRFDDDSFSAALNEALVLDASQINQKRGELEQRFSWERCVQRTLDCYRDVASARAGGRNATLPFER